MLTKKRIAMMFVFAALAVTAAVTTAVGQCDTWTISTIRNCNGYDYELWSQDNAGTTTMKITGNSTNGGTFTADWSNTINILFRAGKKWGSSSTTTARSVGNITVEFAATWSSGDNVKMLGIYGWAYYPSGSSPTKDENGTSRSYSNQIEYYIIQDRGNWNAAAQGTNAKKYGNGATIDGIAYDFYVADRIGQAMLTGSGNFKQYFSVPVSTSSHRQSGTVTVSKHFEEWEKAGMKMMDCPLYEVAMKVESYTGSGSSKGSANVTKNILTLGGSGGNPDPCVTNPNAAGCGTPPPDPCTTNPNGPGCVTTPDPCTATPPPSVDLTGSIVKDGNFPGTSLSSSWALNTGSNYGGSAATAKVCNNMAAITVTAVGAENYQPQLVQKGISLASGNSYTLSFTASGTGSLNVLLQKGSADYDTYGTPKTVTLTSTPQAQTMVVGMSSSDNNAQLAFNLGGASSVTLSGVKLVSSSPTSISGGSKTAIALGKNAPLVSVKGATLSVSPSAGKDLKLRVVDVKGKTVAKFSAVGGGKYSLATMPAGRYIVELSGIGVKQTSAFIVK